ncbi:peptidoglycan bridge formation protein FemAB [Candidatus Levyibacteriota bacterium]|nr:peptidoglycan bridge formation protein FemAB [Candidatus Levybacteria bacterium]
MISKDINDNKLQNKLINHPLQSFEWGKFREKTGLKVIRRCLYKNGEPIFAYQLTIHPIPRIGWNIGYLPKGNFTNQELLEDLKIIGKRENCIFIQIEPNIIRGKNKEEEEFEILLKENSKLTLSAHPLFTKFSFILDIVPGEDELLKKMHSKTRYNINLSQRKGVAITEEISDDAFKKYLKLMDDTTTRQSFYSHTREYHQTQWNILKNQDKEVDALRSHLFIAWYTDDNKNKIPLVAWILFKFKNTLYYPYGASSSMHRETMASNLIMWEAILFGKKNGCINFDMWGALGPTPNTEDPWYGFHKFKEGYGGELVEYIGSYDFILNDIFYKLYKLVDKIRWFILKIKK